MTKTVNGAQIAYRRTGTGPNRVLLLHGWGASMALMAPVAEALAASMEVISLDFPGFGESGRPPEPWGVPDYAAAVYALCEAEDFLPCAVIAHSFGGRVALLLGSEHPGMFTKMVITGGAGLRAPQTEEGQKRAAAFKRRRDIAEKIGRFAPLAPAVSRFQDRLRQKYGSADYNALDEEMRKTFVKVINQDLSDRLPLQKQPTLLVWGDRDTETPLWMGQKMEREIPDAALIILQGGSHFAYLEQVARFNAIVKSFLSEA